LAFLAPIFLGLAGLRAAGLRRRGLPVAVRDAAGGGASGSGPGSTGGSVFGSTGGSVLGSVGVGVDESMVILFMIHSEK
jgi:hypothetical protein